MWKPMLNSTITLQLYEDVSTLHGEKTWRYYFLAQEVGRIEEHKLPGLKTYHTVNGDWGVLFGTYLDAAKAMREKIKLEFVKP